MKTAEIRSRFLKFFEKHQHQVVESSSLVPTNDPTLLFTTAGMVQFKDVFLGKEKRPYTRATTVQKCVRAGGKHNDLENVGFTARHHTFFEMLGNFSFGDYFKKDAIRFAWEFVTKELGIPKDLLYVTVFREDDEAAAIWEKQEGVPKDRLFRLGEKDNFWAMGDTGPCGPCTEIYVDRGEKYGKGGFMENVEAGTDRYMEIWNLVFMQYDRDSSGKLNPLPKPSVDTGAGLERIASVLQNVDSNYDIDLFQNIIGKIAQLAGQPYDFRTETAPSFRVIADHSRATAFLIGDGVLPSNEGRGYVLRRIMRRAIRHGKKLGFNAPFLHKTAGYVIDEMVDAYPDLRDKRAFIEKVVMAEEEQFFRTLEKGLALLDEETKKLTSKTLPGEVAFKLYDTYGFPLDLTRVISEENGISVDEKGFETAMARQRAESRKSWKGSGGAALDAIYLQLADELREKKKLPQFVGYDEIVKDAECVALIQQTEKGIQRVDLAAAPQFAGADAVLVEAIFPVTPFYGESGGQVGDRGRVTGPDFEADVVDVQRPTPDLIVAHLSLKKGTIRTGGKYRQEVDKDLRDLTTRNHTATHLLHWALRKHLGEHVKQAGSIVTPELLRFDFSHFEALKPQDIAIIENMINEKIWRNDGVLKRSMKKDEAVAAGAIAFFGEKYGDVVRVVSVGDYSTELCGGCHVNQSGDIHLFKIVSEGSIAAGVRRIIAYTSKGAFEYLRGRNDMLASIRDQLKAQTIEEVPMRVERVLENERALRKQIEQIQAKAAAGEADELVAKAKKFAKGRLIAGSVASDGTGVKKLRDMAEVLKNKAPDSVLVLGLNDGGKASLLIAVGTQAASWAKANDLLKELAPLIEGKGGGKPDLAQAGGTKAAGLDDVYKTAEAILNRA